MGDIVLGIKLKYDNKDLSGGLVIDREQFRQLATEARKAGEATSGSFTTAAQGVRSISAQLAEAKNAVIGYFGVTQGVAAARWILDQASAMQQLDARLKVSTSSAAEYARAQAGVFEVANRWGAAINETASTFARLNPVIAQLGGNSATTLKMMDGLAASLRLSGATAAETSAVLLQFSQAMGSGRVGGDEFRSMMENAEPLMRAVATQLGKTTAELRQMAEDGKLTSSVFGNALLPAIEKLTKQAEQIPLGISQAWQVLMNNLGRDFGKEFAGQANAVSGAVKGLSGHSVEAAAAVHALADGMLVLGQASLVVASGAAGAWIAKQGQAAAASAEAFLAARAARIAETAAAELQAAADLRGAQATVARTAAALAEANANRAAAAEIALYGAQRAAIERAVTTAVLDHAAAETALAAAQARTAEATAIGTGATALAGRAVTALGGPLAIVLTTLTAGAAAWLIFGERGKSAMQGLNDEVQKGLDIVKRYQKEAKFGTGEAGQLEASLEAVQKKIDLLNQRRDPDARLWDKEKGIYQTLADVRAEAEALQDQLTKIGDQQQSRLSGAGEYSKLTDSLKWREKIVTDYNAKLLNLQTSFSDKMRTTAEKDQAALLRNHQAALAAMLQERAAALDGLPGTKQSLAAIDVALQQSEQKWKAYSEHVKALATAGVIGERQALAEEAAAEQKLFDAKILARQQQLANTNDPTARAKITGDLAALRDEQVAAKQKTIDAYSALDKKYGDEAAKLELERLKQSGQAELAATKDFIAKTSALWQYANETGNQAMLDGLQQAFSGVAASAQFDEAKRRYDALLADLRNRLDSVRQEAERDGGWLAGIHAAQKSEEIKGQLIPAINEAARRMDVLAGANPVNAKTVSDSKREMTRLGEEIDPIWKNAVSRVDSTFHDGFQRMLENGKPSWKAFTESLRNTFKTTVADGIYQFFARPFVFQAMATVSGALGLTGMANAATVATGANAAGSALNGYAGASAFAALPSLGTAVSNLGTIVPTFTTMLSNGATVMESASAAFAGTASSFMAVAPYAAAALLVINKLMSNGGTPTASLGDSTVAYSAAGDILSRTSQYGGTNAATDAYVQGMRDAYAAAVKSMGIGAVASTFAFARNTGEDGQHPNFGLTGSAGGSSFTQGETGTSDAAIQLAASRAVFAALQGSELPGYLSKVFDGLSAGAMTLEQINNVEAFATQLTSVRNALTETRAPLQILQDNVATAFASLHTSAETFKQDFVAAIDAGITPANLAQWQQLGGYLEQLAQNAGAASVTVRSLADIAAERSGLQDQLDSLTMNSTQLLEKQRLALAASNRELFDQVTAAQAAVKAEEDRAARTQAAATERSGLQDQLDSLTMTSADLLAKQRNALAASNRELFDQVTAAQAAKKAQEDLAAAESGLGQARLSWQTQLDVMQGKISQTDADRAAQLAGLADQYKLLAPEEIAAVQAIMRNVWALQDQKSANEAATAAIQKAQQDAANTVRSIWQDAAAAVQKAQQDVTAAQGNLLSAYQREAGELQKTIDQQNADHAKAISDASNSLSQAYQSESAARQGAIDKLLSTAQAYRNFRDTLLGGNLSVLSPEAKYRLLAQQFEEVSARKNAGDQSAIDSFQSVAQNFLTASQGYNASGSGYQADYQRVLAETEKGVSLAETQSGLERQQLAALHAQVSGLINVDASVLAVSDAIAALSAAQTAVIDRTAQTQLDTLNTQVGSLIDINQSVLSVHDAILELRGAQTVQAGAAATQASVSQSIGYTGPRGATYNAASDTWTSSDGTRSASTESIRSQLMALAAAGDGMGIYNALRANGLSMTDMDRFAPGWTAEAQRWADVNHLPRFKDGGMASSGYYIAHENELIYSAAATRIHPAEQTSALMARLQNGGDNKALIEEIVKLRGEVSRLSAIVDKQTGEVTGAVGNAASANSDDIRGLKQHIAYVMAKAAA